MVFGGNYHSHFFHRRPIDAWIINFTHDAPANRKPYMACQGSGGADPVFPAGCPSWFHPRSAGGAVRGTAGRDMADGLVY